MTLILLGKHPTTGEKWWYHTENGLVPFTPEEMDLKKAMDIDERDRRNWEIFNNSFNPPRCPTCGRQRGSDGSNFNALEPCCTCDGDGVALYATAHPRTRGVRLHTWAPWYKRFWWWLTGQIHLNPASLETVEIDIDDQDRPHG
jgi:hypothetical protein